MSCKHQFVPTELHEDYERCTECGTFHSLKALNPESIYLSDYWTKKFDHPSMEEQIHNVDEHEEDGVTKNEFVLDRLVTSHQLTAIELGCAPGVLLGYLDVRFKNVIGLEADPSLEKEIRRIGAFKGQLVFGLFPEAGNLIDKNSIGCLIGLDIFEHAPDPEAFIRMCNTLLRHDGQLFLMSPMVVTGQVFNPRFFHPVEHVWIHSEDHVRQLLEEAGFDNIEFDKWTTGHETVSAFKEA